MKKSKLLQETHQMIKKAVEDNPSFKGLYDGHLSSVVKYALTLGEVYKLDPEMVEIAAVSHDIGKLKISGDNHPEIGANFMKGWLESKGYPEEKIRTISEGIRWHSGLFYEISFNKLSEKNQLFAKIIMCSDALAHLDLTHQLLLLYYNKTKDHKESIQKLINKLEKEWIFKIVLPYAKYLGEEAYTNHIKSLKLTLDYLN